MGDMNQSKLIFFVLFSDFFTFLPAVQSKQADYFWNEALNVMSFHRNKMNEYLCKNYIASEIVESYRNHSGKTAQEETEKTENPLKNSRLARESLLADPGSQKYKDWLSRSSTLEDIYRQFELSEADHHELGHEHEGEVTGYALLGHKHLYSKPEFGEDFHSHGYHGHHKEEKEEEEEENEHHDKGLKLKELFHFALTAIAFLAFACFMIEVIMCLVETPQSGDADYVLVPTTTGTAHASKLDTEVPTPQRQERALNLDPVSLEILNAMSSKVLSSIEALAILHEDDGQCLRRSLCQNSKFSKSLKGTQKIWLPIWSFGMSWIGQRLSSRQNSSRGTSTLEYLKAAVMGLGSRECHEIYPNCNEKRRRKKRKVNN